MSSTGFSKKRASFNANTVEGITKTVISSSSIPFSIKWKYLDWLNNLSLTIANILLFSFDYILICIFY